jgi:hypothetical protein
LSRVKKSENGVLVMLFHDRLCRGCYNGWRLAIAPTPDEPATGCATAAKLPVL